MHSLRMFHGVWWPGCFSMVTLWCLRWFATLNFINALNKIRPQIFNIIMWKKIKINWRCLRKMTFVKIKVFARIKLPKFKHNVILDICLHYVVTGLLLLAFKFEFNLTMESFISDILLKISWWNMSEDDNYNVQLFLSFIYFFYFKTLSNIPQ